MKLEGLSHPQALAQCRHFLRVHFPDIPVHSANSTAAGALEANSSLPVAAIATKRAAEIFGLNILMENIEDQPNNCTRFITLSRQGVGATGRDKPPSCFRSTTSPAACCESCHLAQRPELTEVNQAYAHNWVNTCFLLSLKGTQRIKQPPVRCTW